MTITCRQMIDDATRQIRVRAANETLGAADARDALRDLNTLVTSLNLGQFRKVHEVDLVISDEVDIPQVLEQPVTSMLAVKLAAMFGIAVPAQVALDAERGSGQVAMFRLRHGTAEIDPGLLNTSSYRFSRGT